MALVDLSDATAWQPVNDVVMGGRSESRGTWSGDHFRFEGTVSLEHGGGFASIQRDVGADWSHLSGVRIHVQGDGQRYAFNLYNEARPRRIAYRKLFTAGPSWTPVDIRFEDLKARFRGRSVPDAPPFDPARIHSLSFLIGEKQAGPFHLLVRSVQPLPE